VTFEYEVVTSHPGRVRGIVMCISVCLFVCLSVCPLAELENHSAKHHQILCILPVVVARSSSGGVAIRYVLTSGFVDDVIFSHTGPMARHMYF